MSSYVTTKSGLRPTRRNAELSTWPPVSLANLGDIVTGSTPPTSQEHFFGGDVPFVTPADLDVSDPINVTPRTLTAAGTDAVRLLPKDAVLVCCIGSLGKTGIAGRPLATNQQINAVIFDQKRIWPRYGFYACRRLKRRLEAMAPATTLAIVSKSKFSALEIPVPPMDMQQRIAAILDQADSLRHLRQRAIDRLNSLGQAIFSEMFGPMNGDYSRWPTTSFSDLVESAQIGLVRSANDTGVEFDVPYVRMDAIQRDGLLNLAAVKRTHATAEERKMFDLRTGDFLFNTRNSRELVGKTAVIGHDYAGVYNNNILRVRFKSGISPEYVHSYFRQPVAQREMEARKSGTTNVFAIYQKNLGTLPVPVPPFDLQAAFSGRVRDVNASRALYAQSLDRHSSLFASLQHRAFRGEL